ncbi:hypothetical protein PoB_006051000 [Plakobranchus ocellatus]|uniref:Uncharacterized protein n=1 Tax=Plakobranchus ocellatus TaxID=259542 RepID=A0AAV4CQ23_9GAST|nr:hypothetical protein PoB_006051000 [Plakobranchus ocellatus]
MNTRPHVVNEKSDEKETMRKKRGKKRQKVEMRKELGDFQLLPPQGKMKVLDRPVAKELARTGYIFRDKSEITTSLPQASASIGQDESAR